MLAPAVSLLLRLRLLLGAGERSDLRRGGRRLDRGEARLRRVVGVEEAGLPAVEVGLVADVEEEETGDGLLAVRELDRARVVLGLQLLGHGVGGRRHAEV